MKPSVFLLRADLLEVYGYWSSRILRVQLRCHLRAALKPASAAVAAPAAAMTGTNTKLVIMQQGIPILGENICFDFQVNPKRR